MRGICLDRESARGIPPSMAERLETPPLDVFIFRWISLGFPCGLFFYVMLCYAIFSCVMPYTDAMICCGIKRYVMILTGITMAVISMYYAMSNFA